jgi:DNA-binding transcriptional MerR regulator/methylmalonyl-CoA mutase cobalamin-binding subunit
MSNSRNDPRHPIRIVTRRTGLKPDLIRAWERRYGAVCPERTDTGRRLYSDSDIERLKLLSQAVDAGRGIRLVANLSDQDLAQLVSEDGMERRRIPARDLEPVDKNQILEKCIECARQLDEQGLAAHLETASVTLSRFELLDQLLVPFMQRVGQLWREGELRPVHEHMATAVLRSFAGNLRDANRHSSSAPHLLATTPAGQRHELGALLVAICVATEGWNITYLGTDLPAEEIAAGAYQKRSRVVALSLTFPPDDSNLHRELVRLRRLLPESTDIIVGGRSSLAYQRTLESIGAVHIPSLQELRHQLELLRRPQAPEGSRPS